MKNKNNVPEIFRVQLIPNNNEYNVIVFELGQKKDVDGKGSAIVKNIKDVAPNVIVITLERVSEEKKGVKKYERFEIVYAQIPFALRTRCEFDPVQEKKDAKEREKRLKTVEKLASDAKVGKFPPIPKKLPKLPKRLKDSVKVEE